MYALRGHLIVAVVLLFVKAVELGSPQVAQGASGGSRRCPPPESARGTPASTCTGRGGDRRQVLCLGERRLLEVNNPKLNGP